jgi:hypothetical protein
MKLIRLALLALATLSIVSAGGAPVPSCYPCTSAK